MRVQWSCIQSQLRDRTHPLMISLPSFAFPFPTRRTRTPSHVGHSSRTPPLSSSQPSLQWLQSVHAETYRGLLADAVRMESLGSASGFRERLYLRCPHIHRSHHLHCHRWIRSDCVPLSKSSSQLLKVVAEGIINTAAALFVSSPLDIPSTYTWLVRAHPGPHKQTPDRATAENRIPGVHWNGRPPKLATSSIGPLSRLTDS